MYKKDITTLDDVKLLVDTFYGKVREDALLQPIFDRVIQDNWPEHLAKMYRFWQTVLLDEHTYSGSPFMPHAKLPISGEHFNQWISLFHGTLDEHFEGSKVEEAKKRSKQMATMFEYKKSYYDKNNLTPLK